MVFARSATLVWDGPCSNSDNGGVTFSLLSRYLSCKERFRILTMDGLKPADDFNHRLEFGSMFHVCEEHYLAGKPQGRVTPAGKDWKWALQEYAKGLCKKYPTQQQQVNHWYEVCKALFPLYVQYWEKHDKSYKEQLLQEEKFQVPYTLPSGRIVYLRGKWDSVDISGSGRDRGIWLQENKTKGQINQSQIVRQLSFDAQTMLYLVALTTYQVSPKQYRFGGSGIPRGTPIKGVRYNVIKRPLSGGKGTIVKHKPTKSNPQGETDAEFYARVAEYIKQEPETYFMRWNVGVTESEILKFKEECLDPVLENLCDDYEWWECISQNRLGKGLSIFDHNRRVMAFPRHCPRHFRLPFGVFNVIAEGGVSDLDEYLATGSTLGLQRTNDLFPELR